MDWEHLSDRQTYSPPIPDPTAETAGYFNDNLSCYLMEWLTNIYVMCKVRIWDNLRIVLRKPWIQALHNNLRIAPNNVHKVWIKSQSMYKVWISTIHGLSCAKLGSELCATHYIAKSLRILLATFFVENVFFVQFSKASRYAILH